MPSTNFSRFATVVLAFSALCIDCGSSLAQSYGSVGGGGSYGGYSGYCSDCCPAPTGRISRSRRSGASHGYGSYGGAALMSCGSVGGGNYGDYGTVASTSFEGAVYGNLESYASGGQLAEAIPPGESDAESIYISVTVPEEAKVIVNKKPTVSEGKTREFVIRALEPGKKYKFEVRAEMVNAGGIALEDSITLTLTAGTREEVSLTPIRNRKKPAAAVTLPEPKAAEPSIVTSTT